MSKVEFVKSHLIGKLKEHIETSSTIYILTSFVSIGCMCILRGEVERSKKSRNKKQGGKRQWFRFLGTYAVQFVEKSSNGKTMLFLILLIQLYIMNVTTRVQKENCFRSKTKGRFEK